MLVSLGIQVKVGAKSIEASISLAGLGLVGGNNNAGKRSAPITIPSITEWNGHESRLKLEPPTGSKTQANAALLELLSRAFGARDELLTMNQEDVDAMPVRHRRHLERTARLSYLAPDIVLSIVNGEQPTHLSARKLVRASALPLDWAAQRQMLLAN